MVIYFMKHPFQMTKDKFSILGSNKCEVKLKKKKNQHNSQCFRLLLKILSKYEMLNTAFDW